MNRALNLAKVVDAESATIPGRGNKISIRADHINICKFESMDDSAYKSVAAELKKLALPKQKDDVASVSKPKPN